jgi:hypothetical protein
MIEQVKIDSLESKDNLDVIDFLDEVLDRPVDKINWDWEFNRKGTLFHYCKSENKIIATQSMLPINLTYGIKKVKSYKSESTFIVKEFRGKKIFEGLYSSIVLDVWQNNGQLIWGFTPAIKAWKNNFNFNSNIDSIYSVQTRFRIDNQTNKTIDYFKKFIGIPILFLNRLSLKSGQKKIKIKSIESNRKMFELNKKFLISNQYLGIDLDQDYLEWRLNQNTFLNYNYLEILVQNEKIGFAIYTVSNGCANLTSIRILDEKFLKVSLGSLCDFILNKHQEAKHISYWGNIENKLNKTIFSYLNRRFASKKRLDKSRILVYKFNKLEEIPSEKWLIDSLWTEGIII